MGITELSIICVTLIVCCVIKFGKQITDLDNTIMWLEEVNELNVRESYKDELTRALIKRIENGDK